MIHLEDEVSWRLKRKFWKILYHSIQSSVEKEAQSSCKLEQSCGKVQFAEQAIGGAFKSGALFKHFLFSLQGAKGFYDQLLISASMFWFFIQGSK